MKLLKPLLFGAGIAALVVAGFAFAAWVTMLLGNVILEHYELKTLTFKVSAAIVLLLGSFGFGTRSSKSSS